MTTKRHGIEVGGMPVEIVRKDIKNLHLAVYPPEGTVRVAAPLRVNDDAVRLAVISRLGWIRRRQTGYKRQDRQSPREFVTGESHFFQGKRYRLNVIYHHGSARVVARNRRRIDLYIREGASVLQRARAFSAWYRAHLKQKVPPLIAEWAREMDCQQPDWGIKDMKTRWGTCDSDKRRILVNLELAKKPVRCLEYIIVHEMIHLMERHHNERFSSLMGQFLPQWRLYRDQLNSYPLRHENWEY